MIISLSFKFDKNPSCLKVSRTLLKNDDTLLEFRRTWRFLIGAGSMIMFWMTLLLSDNIKFEVWLNSVEFELSYSKK